MVGGKPGGRSSAVTLALLFAGLSTSLGVPAGAAPDCGAAPGIAVCDAPTPPGPVASDGSVPAPGEVADLLARLTDPNVPYQEKADIITPALTPEEGSEIDAHLGRMSSHGYLPLNFDVTDIQPAPDRLAGSTVGVTGPRWLIPKSGPVVLVDQSGRWAITHDSAMQVMQTLWRAAHGGGGPDAPYFPPFQVSPLPTFGI